MKNYFKIFRNCSSSAGFTLIELLVAMALTSIVVSITGFGLVSIMQNNRKAEAETLRRTELNRTLDFINDEVRMAANIATDASTNLATVAPGFSSSGKTPILTLQIPGVSQRVIYYIASSGSTWLGPNVIYRWGPELDANGKYTTTYGYGALVDLIEDSTPSPNNNCPTSWSANPAVASRQGFYACVAPSGKIAEIYLRGRLTDAYNNPITPLEVSSKVFSRSQMP